MADNFVANAGSGGSTFASDDIGSVHHPLVKVEWGAADTANQTSVSLPMPVQATIETNQMTAAGTILTPKFAVIAATTDNGNNTLVAAVTSKKIRVLGYVLVADATVSARFEGGADGTALTGQMPLVANTGVAASYNPVGWFETATTQLLNLELTGTGNVYGHLVYVEV